MSIAKELELVIRDEKASHIPERVLGVIFPLHHQDLEDLPSKRRDFLDLSVHVFLEIMSIHDGVDLELDAVFLAHPTQFPHLIQMRPFPRTDLDVGFLVEGVA